MSVPSLILDNLSAIKPVLIRKLFLIKKLYLCPSFNEIKKCKN